MLPVLSALLLCLLTPVLSVGGIIGCAGLLQHLAAPPPWLNTLLAFTVGPFLPPLPLGWLWAAKARLPENFLTRWLPLVLPPLLAALALSLHYRADPDEAFGGAGGLVLSLGGLAGAAGYLGLFLGLGLGLRKREAARGRRAGLARLLLIAGVLVLLTGLNLHAVTSRTFYSRSDTGRPAGRDDLSFFFSNGDCLMRPATSPSLRIAANHPLLTGTTDIRPLYAALAQAIYTDIDPLQDIEPLETLAFVPDTEEAVSRIAALTAGEADMAFIQEPDAATLRTLRAPDSPLEATPLARQALVVFVHRDNPLPGLTLAQLRDIYSGKFTNWRDVGGPDAAILPFQHADGTAQQTILRERILNGRPPLPPLREEIFREFPRVRIAAYRNLPGALGFDFRARLRLCFDDDEVRLLPIDGVAPTDAGIRDASWPFTVTYVLLTRREPSAETRALRDWLLGPEGRDFITRCGFVPLF